MSEGTEQPERDEEGPVETDERFPSGPWIGFWLQRGYVGRQWMRDLWLRFADGNVEGSGSDFVGQFEFRGQYDVKTGRCMLYKQYIRAHMVTYDGRNEGDGMWVWGTWMLDTGERGGFHLWPRGVEDPTGSHLEAEADAPVEEFAEMGA